MTDPDAPSPIDRAPARVASRRLALSPTDRLLLAEGTVPEVRIRHGVPGGWYQTEVSDAGPVSLAGPRLRLRFCYWPSAARCRCFPVGGPQRAIVTSAGLELEVGPWQ